MLKVKLINWAKKKFEENKEGRIVLSIQYIRLLDELDRDILRLEKTTVSFKSLDNLKRYLNYYDNNLIENMLKTQFDNDLITFKKFKAKLKSLQIFKLKPEEARIKGYYWKK